MAEQKRYTREALYDLVWQEPPSRLAQRFGLSDVGFSKLCRRLQVPLPARGYWQRHAAGRRVERPNLPDFVGDGQDWVELSILNDEELTQAEKQKPQDDSVAVEVRVPASTEVLSKAGAVTFRRLSKGKPDERGRVLPRFHGHIH
ncbi:hypothetical protein H0Z60_14520 [Ectothiorhodospiraceae bacterium WFHF3C12]|nr:hypothetical protein [Ectothiorhodospiraceae bacterium WFHF3C12]